VCKNGLEIPNRLGKMSEKCREDFFYSLYIAQVATLLRIGAADVLKQLCGVQQISAQDQCVLLSHIVCPQNTPLPEYLLNSL